MADIFSKEKRSEIMSRIRGKNTVPEKTVFRFLRLNRIYFQRHYRRAPGTPDIALPRKKKAVFIDGDFWHGWRFEERRERLVAAGQHFWVEKIERNIQRDARDRQALREAGWEILCVWEHDLIRKRTQADTLQSIALFLSKEMAEEGVGECIMLVEAI